MIKEMIKTALPKGWTDRLRVARSALRSRFTYAEDFLFTTVNADFLKEKPFVESYGLGRSLMLESWGDYQFHWRAYILCWAAWRAKDLEGDFVECGVNTGMCARMIINYINFDKLPKKFYLLDTFEGMLEKYSSPKEMERSRTMGYHDVYEEVRRTFGPFKNVEIIKGAVPETLFKVGAERVAFLSMDMNCVRPEVEALEFFWDKLTRGAAILLDDYGFPGHEEQKEAHDDFARRRGVMVLPSPTGQGLIFKP